MNRKNKKSFGKKLPSYAFTVDLKSDTLKDSCKCFWHVKEKQRKALSSLENKGRIADITSRGQVNSFLFQLYYLLFLCISF